MNRKLSDRLSDWTHGITDDEHEDERVAVLDEVNEELTREERKAYGAGLAALAKAKA